MATIPQSLSVILALFLSTDLCLQFEGVMSYTVCINVPLCRCYTDVAIVDCSDREFTSIPDIHATILTLNLSRNDIDTIPTRAFSKLSKLQSLDLRRNKIWRVESLAFEGLVNLTVINLSLNIIDRIPTQAFLKLSKLQSLNLFDNQIRTFDPLAFEGLGNLIDINLSKNNISTIPTHALSMLSKLESLDLSWNQIHTVDPLAFEGLESLIDINFRWNLLSEVPSIGSQPRLSKLDLSWNRIVNATFPSSYRSSYYNLSVDLFCNKIESLDRFTFSSLAGTTIVDMDLSNNFISYVGPDTFVPLTSIKTLNLGYNTLSKVPSIGFLSRVSKLDLSANRIVNATFPSIYRSCYNNISVDLSDNKIETLDRFTFSSLAGTTIVAMNLFRNNILSVGPGTFDPLTSIETLNLDYNKLSEVSFIGSLSRVSNLHLSGNSIVNATFPFIYGSSYNNISVYLSRNKITTLDKFTFSSLADTTIVEMDLSYNNISSVGPGTFDPLASIEHLRLYENVLSEVPSIGFLPRLSELHLSYNRIVNATFPSTYRNTYNIISIYLSWNKIETIDIFTFSSLAGTTIVDMDLSFNNISYVGPGTFDPLESIERLYLCYNPLSNEALKYVADSCSRKQVTLAFGNLESLINGISAFMNSGIRLGMCASYSSGCVFEEFQNLTIIWLTKHDLVRISELDFPGKKNVLAMDLAENVFLSFPKYLPTSLESLDLRGNEISELNQNELSYLGSLKTLLLTRNRIVDLWSGAFNGLGNLRELDLAQNRIGTVSRDLFDPLQNLTHLYLCKNGLNYLPKLSRPLVSLRVLDLSENAIDTVDRPFSESFPSLQILQLDGNNLGEPVFQSDRGGHLFTGLIKLNEVSISRNNIHNLPDMLFQDQVSLKNLNISNNQISGWGPNMFKFTRNFAKLDISFNLIPFLVERKLHDHNNLKKLHMKGNPFICNCDFHLLRKWIDRTSVALPDKEFYTCNGPEEWRGKRVLEFTKDKINCTMIPTIVGTISGALFFSAILVILVYRHRWRLRLRLYLLSKCGRHFLRYVRGYVQNPNDEAINDDGRQDNYDAYISCNDLDYDWVLQHLPPGVDNGHYDDDLFGGDFKLYFDPRDQEPGTMAIANIFEHMSRSRKVIVVLTQHYLNDGMNLFELDQATTLYHDQELDDIIVIKVGDVPARRVPAHLYTQMRTGIFLEWEHEPNAIERVKSQVQDRLRGDRVDLC